MKMQFLLRFGAHLLISKRSCNLRTEGVLSHVHSCGQLSTTDRATKCRDYADRGVLLLLSFSNNTDVHSKIILDVYTVTILQYRGVFIVQ